MIRNRNEVVITGYIADYYTTIFNVESDNKSYMTTISTRRLSGVDDEIKVVIPDRLIELPWNDKGSAVTIRGEFRSRNVDGHCELYIAAKELVYGFMEFENDIKFSGYICKPPTFRETSLGRKILDLFVAVNRGYGKSAYIPCITWGDNACWGKNALNMGDYVECEGRIQSREYLKHYADGTEEVKTAYEVSINKLEVVTNENV